MASSPWLLLPGPYRPGEEPATPQPQLLTYTYLHTFNALALSGVVTGTLTADDVIGGAAAQGIAAEELDEVIEAIHAGVAYCNVHTGTFLDGEIRGQLK